jgi:hypothetical protein
MQLLRHYTSSQKINIQQFLAIKNKEISKEQATRKILQKKIQQEKSNGCLTAANKNVLYAEPFVIFRSRARVNSLLWNMFSVIS